MLWITLKSRVCADHCWADTKVVRLFLNLITHWNLAPPESREGLPLPSGFSTLSFNHLFGSIWALRPGKKFANNSKFPLGVRSQHHSLPMSVFSWAYCTGPLNAINRTVLGHGEWEAGRLPTSLGNWMPLILIIVLYLNMFREECVAWLHGRTHVQNFEHITKSS